LPMNGFSGQTPHEVLPLDKDSTPHLDNGLHTAAINHSGSFLVVRTS
jgi:hypothetical protein